MSVRQVLIAPKVGNPSKVQSRSQSASQSLPEEQNWSSFQALGEHVELQLGLSTSLPKAFGPHLWDPEAHKVLAEYSDFVDPGFQQIWLAENPDTLTFSWPSNDSLPLSFGVNSQEWKQIFVEDPGINTVPAAQLPREYPLLARLRNIDAPVKYRANEVSPLQEECLKAARVAKDNTSIRGLDKLVISSGWAAKLGYGLVFVENEEGE
jgi:hypothetical protein